MNGEEKLMQRNQFQKNLRKARQAAGLSGTKMAQLLNVPATTYRGYENSGRQPDFETLLKISDILGVPADTLIRDSSQGKSKNIRKTFSAKLKSAREKKGITQQALAEQIGISASTVGKWETGIIEPDLTDLFFLSHALDVSVDTLLGIDRKSADSILDIVHMLDRLDEHQLQTFRDFLETLVQK